MAGSNGNGQGGMISGINMTPMVDITLVLLIVFLVTAKLVLAPQSVKPLNLPTSATSEQVVSVIAITLTSDGEVQVNGQSLRSDDALLAYARAQHTAHPDARAVLQADGEVRHARVVHVLDLLAQASITQIGIAVVPK